VAMWVCLPTASWQSVRLSPSPTPPSFPS
jgi:hypothetical protein